MSDGRVVRVKLDLSLVIAETFGILSRNLSAILVVAFVIALATTVVALVIDAALSVNYSSVRPQRAFSSAPALEGLVSTILRGVAVGGITRIAIGDLDGQRVGAGLALSTGFGLLLPLLGLGVVYGFGVGAASILLVIPGIWLAIRWIVSTPVRVVEGPTIGKALSRSSFLTKGNTWRLFALGVAFVILTFGIQFSVEFILGLFVSGSGAGGTVATVIKSVVAIVGSTISTSIVSTVIAVCYVELRRLSEGSTFRDLAAVFN